MFEMNLALESSSDLARQRLTGTVIADKYRLDELLGAGSQGMVWKAHNLDLDLPVAVKLMHPLGDMGLAVAPNRLFREARAAATLGHPGIVRIFDFGRTADGLPFLTMELLQGVSLSRHLQEARKLSPELAVRLVLPIADALSAAHAQGIVHRDVKPDNILLSVSAGQMQPKLLDFGIARVADAQPLTQAGCVVGTPNYLPPEQARGLEEVDARADIWSLCATLYECVTGAVPFAAATWIDVLRCIIDEEPESLGAHGIDEPELWRLIHKGLAKRPDERWQSIQEFARAASKWLLARGVSCDICGVSVESRWLRPSAASTLGTTLGSGETQSSPAWWEHVPPAAPRPRLDARRRKVLAVSVPLLCIVAVVGATRAGAWLFDSQPDVAAGALETPRESPVKASGAALGLSSTDVVSYIAPPADAVLATATVDATRARPAQASMETLSNAPASRRSNREAPPPTGRISKTVEAASSPPDASAAGKYVQAGSEATSVAVTPQPTDAKLPLRHAARAAQSTIPRAAAPKPAIVPPREALDLMDPY